MILMTPIEIGDVVQISPEVENSFFPGCFMQVTKIKSWGVQGFICIPDARDKPPGHAYYRANYEDIERVGKAIWILEDTDDSE